MVTAVVIIRCDYCCGERCGLSLRRWVMRRAAVCVAELNVSKACCVVPPVSRTSSDLGIFVLKSSQKIFRRDML